MTNIAVVPTLPVQYGRSLQEEGIPLRSEPPFMLWWIVGVHMAWALGLVFEPITLSAIALVGLDWLVEYGLGADFIALILASFAILAAIGLLFEKWMRENLKPRVAMAVLATCLVPQYFLVIIAFTSDISILLDSDYRSTAGSPIASWVLITILFPVVWGAMLHTAAILLRAELAVRGFPPWPPRGQRGRWMAIWKPE